MTEPLHYCGDWGERCAHCTRALGGAAERAGYHAPQIVWTYSQETYERPPPGYHQCSGKASGGEAPTDLRGVQGRAVSSKGGLMGLWRDAQRSNTVLWGRIRGAIAPVCRAAGVDPDHELVGLLLGEALLPPSWGVLLPPRVRAAGVTVYIPSVHWAYSELVAPAVVVLAASVADWTRYPSVLWEVCQATASVCLAEGFCSTVGRLP